MIFDTHAHYYDKAFDADREAVLNALPQRGVELVLCPGCDLGTSRAAIDLAERWDWIYAAVGFHPEDLEGASLADLDQLRHMAGHPKVRAVGEIGLDYYWVKTPEERARSRDFFDAQLSLAEELDLPAIIHDRDAHRDCLDIVRAHPNCRGVFHCCALSLEDARTAVDLGWMLSFTGNLTFPGARRGPQVASWVPMDRLLLETDAPYMAPVPHRGERCDSSLIPLTAGAVARWRGMETEEVLAITRDNGRRLFAI